MSGIAAVDPTGVRGSWPKAPSRRVVERDLPYGGRVGVKMSCGHVFSVRAYSRYSSAKTLGCIKCQAGTPVGPEDVL